MFCFKGIAVFYFMLIPFNTALYIQCLSNWNTIGQISHKKIKAFMALVKCKQSLRMFCLRRCWKNWISFKRIIPHFAHRLSRMFLGIFTYCNRTALVYTTRIKKILFYFAPPCVSDHCNHYVIAWDPVYLFSHWLLESVCCTSIYRPQMA